MFALIMFCLAIESIDLLVLQIENSVSNCLLYIYVCLFQPHYWIVCCSTLKVSVCMQVCSLCHFSPIYSNLSGFDHICIEIDLDNESR